MAFKELSNEPVKEKEKRISEYWKKINLLDRSIEIRKDNENYVFYDGPPTANGKPGIHHVISRTLKDMTCRYKTMKGYQVHRKAGWDTHGLPVEIEVEKELGLSNKKGIEEYGVEKFNQKCKESVFKYRKEWTEMSERMAFLVDMDDPYVTLENNYIESVWHLLDNFNKKGLIYKGAKILPYCPRCGTGLASHEVAQGYKEDKVETVYVKFKKKDEDAYFLAWTTTPWTLPSNVGLAVNPNITYVKLKDNTTNEVYYLAKDLISEVLRDDEVEIIEELKGKDMEYMEYEQLLPYIKPEKSENSFIVALADYVSTDSGTGIVHTAPAFGEEDYATGRRYGFPLVNPVDDEGKFTETPWKGIFVMDADKDIIQLLRDENKLYRKQKLVHNYPHCWRCGTPLIYYSKPSWYIEVTKYKDQMVENNKKVNWFPEFVGEKRFGNWLENLNDWAISRSRYWGTPLNIWKCEDCGKYESIGSIKELVERANEDIDENIELHRPYVDEVHLTCSCGGKMTREKDVVDVWFDSGAMPFAQWHYPFGNKEIFEESYPADFICEGIDQTRGWFYSLMAISTMEMGISPYKNVLVNELILDKNGQKMSKSKGNTINPIMAFDEYGADAVRFYSVNVSPAWIPTKFDIDGLKEVNSKIFRTFKNVYNFFELYANTDEIDPREFVIPYEDREEIDKWLLSKYNSLVKFYHENMDNFEYTKVTRAITDFVVEDLSNWYIRRNRRRFWSQEKDDSKLAVYNTTYEVLVGITKLLAPITPFISEEFYQNLVGGESVHLELLQEANEDYIDLDLERKMDLVRKIVNLGRASREEVNIKVRQPLSEIIVDGKYEDTIYDLVDLIKEELNVKEVKFESDLSNFMEFNLKPNYKEVGRVLGKKVQTFAKYLNNVDTKSLLDDLENGTVEIDLDGDRINIDDTYVEVSFKAKEGFDVNMDQNVFVILDTKIDDELKSEGYMREFISKVQQLRKNNDYELTDLIEVYYDTESEEVKEAITKHRDIIMEETLAEVLEEKDLDTASINLNDQEIKVETRKL